MVGSLVEAAAQEIGANHLLAKVAVLYHDLDKAKKSPYFVENQGGGPNRHDKLGLSIERAHPDQPCQGGHGSGAQAPTGPAHHRHHRRAPRQTDHLLFLQTRSARPAAPPAKPSPIPRTSPNPGPQPQTHEAGLVMLADAVEAASRVLDNLTPARLQGLIQTQTHKTFSEGSDSASLP